MIEKIDENGKRYCEVTDDELKALNIKEYYIGKNRKKMISSPNCKHEFVIEKGLPRNFKCCKKCIYWEFTMQSPTVGG